MLIEQELKKNLQREMFYDLLEECYDMSHRYRCVNADKNRGKHTQPKANEKETTIEKKKNTRLGIFF